MLHSRISEEFQTYSMMFQLQSFLNGVALNLASLKCAVFLQYTTLSIGSLAWLNKLHRMLGEHEKSL